MCAQRFAGVWAVAILLLASTCAPAQLIVDIESAAVFTGYNDVQIPGDVGTRFSLSDNLESDVGASFRLRVEYTINERHTFSGLYAPLTIQASGASAEPVLFEGVAFPAATDLEGEYTFNSYRFTYRYEFAPRGRLQYGLGLTGKIRDAAIRLEGGGLSSKKTNVGFVPLINFRLRYALNDRLSGVLSGDALAAPQGRAEDVFVGILYQFADSAAVKIGYRILEGGADNDEVYNFALLNYAVLGLALRF